MCVPSCSVLQCVAVCRSVLQCVAVLCSVSQCVVVCHCIVVCTPNTTYVWNNILFQAWHSIKTHTQTQHTHRQVKEIGHQLVYLPTYGVATISRLFKIIGLYCKRALQKRHIFFKETYNFKGPTNRQTNAPTPTRTHTHTHAHTHTYTHTYKHIPAHTHTYARTHTHTRTQFKGSTANRPT